MTAFAKRIVPLIIGVTTLSATAGIALDGAVSAGAPAAAVASASHVQPDYLLHG